MKTCFVRLCLLLFAWTFCACTLFGHERPVHRRITETAADSALATSQGYAGFLNTVPVDVTIAEARQSLSDGSDFEDNLWSDEEGGIRSLNHFYDPLTGEGLSNIPPDDRLIDFVTGQNLPYARDSFTWGATRDCPGLDIRLNGIGVNVNTRNIWSWQNARDYQWDGLTEETPAARRQALLNMYRALGQVVHLLEDASQPEHTRNEQHFFSGSAIEESGRACAVSFGF